MTTAPTMTAAPANPLNPIKGPPSFQDAVLRALRQGTVVLMATVLVRSLVLLDANRTAYSRPSYEWVGFGLLVGVAGAVGVCAVRDLDLRRLRGPLTLLTLAASVLATAGVPPDLLLTQAHWSWYIIGWFLLALYFGERPWRLSVALAVHLALVLGQVRLAGPLDRRDLAELLIRGTLFTGAQLAFGSAGAVARGAGRLARKIAAREAAERTAQRIADEVLADQQARHAAIAATTVPLLQGLTDGLLQPEDPVVQRRCRVEAARLRRLMAEADRSSDPLEHELRACLEVAERSGVQVDVAYRGAGPTPELAARRSLMEPVIGVLAHARSVARVTVVSSERDVVVSVLADVDHGIVLPESLWEGDQVEVVRSPDQVWATARWPAPAGEPA